jgi:hypothetical protein
MQKETNDSKFLDFKKPQHSILPTSTTGDIIVHDNYTLSLTKKIRNKRNGCPMS